MNQQRGLCTVCDRPVYDSDEYQADFFGSVAHSACLDTVVVDQDLEEDQE